MCSGPVRQQPPSSGSGITPLLGRLGEAGGVSFARPGARLGVPSLAGVGVDDDRLGCRRFHGSDQWRDECWGGAVDPDGHDLRHGIEKATAIGDWLAMGGVGCIPAGKAHPGGDLRILLESPDDGAGFFEGWDGLEGDDISVGVGEHSKAPSVEAD